MSLFEIIVVLQLFYIIYCLRRLNVNFVNAAQWLVDRAKSSQG